MEARLGMKLLRYFLYQLPKFPITPAINADAISCIINIFELGTIP
jgi:hypothetical protein